jgi:hypothetical protein
VSTANLNNEILNASLSNTYDLVRYNNDATKMVLTVNKDNANYFDQFKHYSKHDILIELAKAEWQHFNAAFDTKNYDQDKKDDVLAAGSTAESMISPSLFSKIAFDDSEKSSIQKAIPVSIHKPEETSFSRATHDFTNKCTWYTNSIQITGETLTLHTGNTYDFAHDFIIDTENGVINRQDLLQATYGTVIYENGSPATTGYTIDHRNGSVTFDAAPTAPVTADYSYATDSQWSIAPDPGKMLIIEHSEVQFADDVDMVTPMIFQVLIDNPYLGVPGHPYEFGPARLPVDTVQYNSIRDIVNESNLGYQVPAMLGIGRPVIVFPFNYVTVKPIYGSMNAELTISAVGDLELPGTYGTATFYLVSRDET